jgi:hypothetical protein
LHLRKRHLRRDESVTFPILALAVHRQHAQAGAAGLH